MGQAEYRDRVVQVDATKYMQYKKVMFSKPCHSQNSGCMPVQAVLTWTVAVCQFKVPVTFKVFNCNSRSVVGVWSHPNITCRMQLKYLSKFRSRPDIFNVTKNSNVGKTSKFLLEHENWIVLTYRQLLVWGKVRDFGVDLQLVEVGGMPTDLIAFARALQGVHAGSLPGPDAGVPKSRVRVLKVKQLVDKNKISLLQGKRTHEQMRSGSRDFDKATRLPGPAMEQWQYANPGSIEYIDLIFTCFRISPSFIFQGGFHPDVE